MIATCVLWGPFLLVVALLYAVDPTWTDPDQCDSVCLGVPNLAVNVLWFYGPPLLILNVVVILVIRLIRRLSINRAERTAAPRI